MAFQLPEMCFVKNDETGETVMVRAQVRGYFSAHKYVGKNADVDDLNQRIGVTKRQAAAMKVGSMFGFHVPGADPNKYDDEGRPK
jgi:hypothetical protein